MSCQDANKYFEPFLFTKHCIYEGIKDVMIILHQIKNVNYVDLLDIHVRTVIYVCQYHV